MLYISKALKRAVSSVGRALRLHRRGFTGSSPVPPTIRAFKIWGRSVAGLTRQIVDLKIAGSNPVVPAIKIKKATDICRFFYLPINFCFNLLQFTYGHENKNHDEKRDGLDYTKNHQVVAKALACLCHCI